MDKEELKKISRYIHINIEGSIPFTVDLQNHKVMGWDEMDGSKSIFEKVVDTGIYTLLDENKNDLYRIEGYVPNNFLPEKDGYGDYLSLNIAKDGTMTNWYDNPDFQEFIEQGYSTLPVTSENNINEVINTFLLPLAKRINEKLLPFVENGFLSCNTQPQLSLMPETTHNCLELSLDEETNKKNPEYSKYLRETKSLWLDFYARCPLSSTQKLRYINIWTDIKLSEKQFIVKAINKAFSYTGLPSGQEIGTISNKFKYALQQMIEGKTECRQYIN